MVYIEYKTSPAIVRKIKAVEDFIDRYGSLFSVEEIEEKKSCVFDLKILFTDNKFLDKWPSFKDDIVSDLSTSLNCLGLAIYQVSCERKKLGTRPLYLLLHTRFYRPCGSPSKRNLALLRTTT